jgi:hypothetical protein
MAKHRKISQKTRQITHSTWVLFNRFESAGESEDVSTALITCLGGLTRQPEPEVRQKAAHAIFLWALYSCAYPRKKRFPPFSRRMVRDAVGDLVKGVYPKVDIKKERLNSIAWN